MTFLIPAEKTDEFGRAVSPVKYGYVEHIGGPWIIEPIFDDALDFSDKIAPYYSPLAHVKVGNKWGIIHNDGTFFIKPKFYNIHNFHEGIAAVSIDYQHYKDWGYIKLDGSYLVAPMFDSAEDFHDGYGKVRATSETRGFLQPDGSYMLKTLSEIEETAAAIDYDDVNIVGKKLDGKTGYIDKNGFWHDEK